MMWAAIVTALVILGSQLSGAMPSRAQDEGDSTSALRQDAMAAYEQGDLERAVAQFTAAANRGDAAAQVNLGWLYSLGHGVPQDYREALRWFWLAAAQGNAGAEFSLGTMYEHGRGVDPNLSEAARWYRSAADKGNAQAQNNLGWLYQNGEGVPLDYAAAAGWYQRAAEQRQPDAIGNLGYCTYYGLGVPKDRARGLDLLRHAVDLGDVEAGKVLDELSRMERLRREQTQAQAQAQAPTPANRSPANPAPRRPESPRGAERESPPQRVTGTTERSTLERGASGGWRSKGPIVDVGLRRMYLGLVVADHAVTFRYDCRYLDGSQLTGQFTTRAAISPMTIQILEPGQSRVTDANNVCQASMRAIELPYRVDGDEMTLIFPNQSVVLRRTPRGG